MKEKEFYALLGEFCVEFENVCFGMEQAVHGVLERAGLKGLECQPLRNIILDSKTAEPLQKMLRAMWVNELDQSLDEKQKKQKKQFPDIFKRLQSLTEKRNIWLHTKWIAPIDDGKHANPDVMGKKIKANSSGDSTLFIAFNEQELSNDIKECKDLQKIISAVDFYCTRPSVFDQYDTPQISDHVLR